MGASESKLAFKEDIFRLAGEPDIPAEDPWWTRFYTLPETADDVFALWSPTDLRNLTSLTETAPDNHRASAFSGPRKNLETLIYVVVGRLESCQAGRGVGEDEQGRNLEVLNCLRILTRLLPYMYEADHLGEWEEQFFWQPRRPTWVWDRKYNRRGPLFDGLNPRKRFSDAAEEDDIGRPLGEQIVDLLVGYLFFPGFTLPKNVDAEGRVDMSVQYSIWQSGIGCKQSLGMSKENERNAMEVLRLMLTMTSRMMYISPNVVAQTDVRALTYLTTQSGRQVVLSVVCSLLNTVLKYNPASWRVPLDLTSITKDPKQLLVIYSLQVLLILTIYQPPDLSSEPNAFRKALSRLHRAEDFQFIQQGLTLVLTQPVSGVASYVPTASKALPWAPEMLVLFWELLQCNKRFRSFIIDTDRAHDFLVLVLYYAMDAKDDPARQGIVRMCVFILQTLSVEPAFGARLNKAFVGQDSLPSILRIPNFHGSYADYLVTSVHTILTTTKGRLESIYPALLAVVSNVAPYLKDLQRATSSRLVELFASLSTPAFLLGAEGNHLMLESLLEAFNAVLEHQYEANRRFIDVIVRSHKRFEALHDFTVNGALSELDRQAQERKDRASATSLTSPPRTSGDSIRSPTSTRTPSLGNVPEHGAFAIGDDEDDEDTISQPNSPQQGRSRASISELVDGAVPVQTRSMSEKARGKQPVSQSSFSRSASRNTSTTSLASLNTPAIPGAPPPGAGSFTPTAEWLETWLPHLPLHTILSTISQERATKTSDARPTRPPPVRSDTTSTTGTDNGPPPIKLQTFTWSPLSLGWYFSMLWGFIYAQDGQANKGVSGLWAGTNVRLFRIERMGEGPSLRNPRGAVDAVGAELGRRVAGLGFGKKEVEGTGVREV